MTTLRLRLSDDLVREIDRRARDAGQEREEFIADTLRRRIEDARGIYSARMTTRSSEMVREQLRPYAEEAGFTEEEDILADVPR